MQKPAGAARRPMRWFTIWLVAEIVLFVVLSEWFGFGRVLVAQIASSLIGVALFRRLARAPAIGGPQSPQPPEAGAAKAVGSGLSALLFTMPGFLSTLAALLLSVPFVSRRFHLRLERWFRRNFSQAPGFGGRAVDLDTAEWRSEQADVGASTSLPRPEHTGYLR